MTIGTTGDEPRPISDELLAIFLQEAEQRLGEMRTGLSGLQKSPPAWSEAESLWRGAHAVRGNAAMVGFNALSDLAGATELAAKAVSARAQDVGSAVTNVFAHSIAGMRCLVSDIAAQRAMRPVDRALIEKLDVIRREHEAATA